MKILWSAILGCSLFFAADAWAAGPISVVPTTGSASKWGSTITLHPEGGRCGGFTNAQMKSKLGTNLSTWEDVSNVSLTFSLNNSAITADINNDNYSTYYVSNADDVGLNDNLNPIVFDDDGQIVAHILGIENMFTVLGFAGPDGFSSDYATIVDGQAVFNCRCLASNSYYSVDNDSGESCDSVPQTFTVDDLDFTMVHEMGHFLGLDHSQVNADGSDLPTMYPESVDAAEQLILHHDDETAIRSLYGQTALEDNYCTVIGTLYDSNGKSLRCADVQASTGDEADTVSTVSGYYATYQDLNNDGASDGDGECLTNCGVFLLRGLEVGKTYSIDIVPIDSGYIGSSRLGPCVHAQITGIRNQKITTVTCSTAGQSTNIGSFTTASTGGIAEGTDDSGSTTGSSSSGGCQLNQKSSFPISWLWMVMFSSLLVSFYRCRRASQQSSRL